MIRVSKGISQVGDGISPVSPGTKYLHHNIIDSCEPMMQGRNDPNHLLDDKHRADKGASMHWHSAFGDHGASPINDPWKVYSNTLIFGSNRNGVSITNDDLASASNRQEFYNNIIIQIMDDFAEEGARVIGGSHIFDGNLWYRSVVNALTPLYSGWDGNDFSSLSDFKASQLFVESKAYYAPGWENSGIEADPLLDNEYFPAIGGPSVSGAVDLSSKGWPGTGAGGYRGAREALNCSFTSGEDSDGDSILDDGDYSGTVGDNPCIGGNFANCDDNCVDVCNPDQADMDRDGVGDTCDNCSDISNSGQSDYDMDSRGDVCDGCPETPPVEMAGNYYTSLQSAYEMALDDQIIKVQDGKVFTEELSMNRSVSVTLAGGYDCDHANVTGKTTFYGNVTIVSGTVTIGDFVSDRNMCYEDEGTIIANPPRAPVTDLSGTPVSGDAPLSVSFTDQSTGSVTSWEWDFDGDGIADSTVQNPSHIYNQPGTYSVSLTVTGPGGSDTEAKGDYITVTEPSILITVDIQAAAGSDDAEESESGSVNLNSSDLELVDESTNQTVGMRFNGVEIPQGAAIINAFIQFQVDEDSTGAVSLTIEAEANDNALTFTSGNANISSRPRTTASADWTPASWPIVGEAGVDQQTSDLASVIQEIVNRPGWTSGNSLVIIITGTGKRVAEAYNGNQAGAPILHVEYTLN
jgi:PKD repeat protein